MPDIVNLRDLLCLLAEHPSGASSHQIGELANGTNAKTSWQDASGVDIVNLRWPAVVGGLWFGDAAKG